MSFIANFETDYGLLRFAVRNGNYDTQTIRQVVTKKRNGGEYFTHIDINILKGVKKWIDIGGHVGAFAIRMAKQFNSSVVSFEPFLESYELMQQSVKLNQLEKKIKPVNAAIVGKVENSIDGEIGKASFFVNSKEDGNFGVNSLTARRGRKEIVVDTISINLALSMAEFEGMKIDIEGYEAELIPAIDKNSLKRMKVAIIEWHFNQIKDDAQRSKYFGCIDILKSCFKEVIYLEEPNKHWTAHIFCSNL